MREPTNKPESTISDDELLFFYWRDGLTESRQRDIAAALKQDPALQARLASLSIDMSQLHTPTAPDPDDLYAARVLRQFDQAIARTDKPVQSTRIRQRASTWLWPVAAAVLLGVLLWQRPGSAPTEIVAIGPEYAPVVSAQAEALNRRVAVELEQAATQLVDFDRLDDAARQQLLESWRSQNELFALAAERSGDAQLARTLRAFGPLLDLLNDSKASGRDAALSQLQFEYAIMHTKLLREPSKSTANEI